MFDEVPKTKERIKDKTNRKRAKTQNRGGRFNK